MKGDEQQYERKAKEIKHYNKRTSINIQNMIEHKATQDKESRTMIEHWQQ